MFQVYLHDFFLHRYSDAYIGELAAKESVRRGYLKKEPDALKTRLSYGEGMCSLHVDGALVAAVPSYLIKAALDKSCYEDGPARALTSLLYGYAAGVAFLPKSWVPYFFGRPWEHDCPARVERRVGGMTLSTDRGHHERWVPDQVSAYVPNAAALFREKGTKLAEDASYVIVLADGLLDDKNNRYELPEYLRS